MRIEVLGAIQLRDDDGNPIEVPERKVRALIASLAAARGEAVPSERLVDQVWGDSLPKNPARVLQAKLSQLRSLLDEASPGARQMLVRSAAGYSLDLPAETLDAAGFRERVRATADQLSDQEQVAVLEQALALWRGEPYAEFADELWLTAEIGDLQEVRLQAVQRCAETLTAMGEPERAVACAAPYFADNPTREALVAPLLVAYYRTHRQPEALAVYERLRNHLAEELGADPSPQLQELHLKILRQDPELEQMPAEPPDRRSPVPRQRLPAYASPFLGREPEVAEILGLLSTRRLVTLTGIGGIGKTRLAVEVAEQAAEDTSAAAYFVDLTELDAPAGEDPGAVERQVARVAAATLGLPAARDGGAELTERIAASMQDRSALLVLDNCEHVVAGAAAFAERVLRAVGTVRILATSREPLALPEEQRYRVPQLPVNGRSQDTEPSMATRSPAVEFFLTRAREVDPELEADQDTMAAAAELCRRLDGLPLALELAAARTNVLTVPQLLERITDSLDLLVRPGRGAPRRQQTLRGMLDWSWSLLEHQEQVLLRRLAVHPVSWRLDVIEEICTGGQKAPGASSSLSPGGVLPALSRLVDSSLVATVKTRDGLRYRLLETVHSYAAEKLAEAGERAAAATAHLNYFRAMAEGAEQYLFSRHAKGWVDWMNTERSHLGHALAEALRRQDGVDAAALVLSTFWFRWMTARTDSLAEDLAAAAACPFPELSAENRNLRAQVLVLARSVQQLQPQARVESVLAALETFSDDDAGRLARMRVQWFASSCLLAHQEHRELGEELVGEAVEHLIATGDLPGAAFASTQRDWFLMEHWDIHPRGLPSGYDAEKILREHGDVYGMTQVLGVQYLVAAAEGATARVETITEEAARLAEDLGLEGELAYWQVVRALNSIRAEDRATAENHLQRARELARRTAYAFCLSLADAVEAVLVARNGQPAETEHILTQIPSADRDLVRRTLCRALGDKVMR